MTTVEAYESAPDQPSAPRRVVWQRIRVAPGRGPSAWEWRAVPVEASGWRRAKELR